MKKFYKYHGAGNDFLLYDNRSEKITLTSKDIQRLCDRHFGIGADGLMLLNDGRECEDFSMDYFNSDGSGGMMCGNGGRCIVAFAADLGIKSFNFSAPDGPHEAVILENNGLSKIVKLKMKDVRFIEELNSNEYFLDTGTRHFVRFVDSPEKVVIDTSAIAIRHDARFTPIGTNVNIAYINNRTINMRTFEKGVEAETMACGTGVVATALAASKMCGNINKSKQEIAVNTPGGDFIVEFTYINNVFTDVFLIGPASFIATVYTPLV